eukprot:COSAG02_NODE_2932_length_7712_cov_2.172468_2_plen_53_part_00
MGACRGFGHNGTSNAGVPEGLDQVYSRIYDIYSMNFKDFQEVCPVQLYDMCR